MARTCRICGREHRVGIGGTTMAAILGLSPWKNALDAYHGLTRPDELYSDEEIESIDLRRGRELEAKIGEWYTEETGEPVEPWEGWAEHPDFPAFVVHPDFRLPPHDGKPEGVLEAKAPRWSVFQRVYEEGLRQSEIVQLSTYAAVLGYERAAFAYGNLEHEAGPCLPIDPGVDEELGAFILEVGQRFWDEHVQPRIPPDPDEWRLIEDPASPTVVETTGEREEVEDPELVELTRQLLEAKSLKKKNEELYEERRDTVKAIIEERYETDRIRVPGVAKLTIVRNAGRKKFSKDALRGHRPIDRDHFVRWLREGRITVTSDELAEREFGSIAEAYDAVADDLALDLDQFVRQGDPYSYLLPTEEK